jgi:hypothetical protein
MDESRNDGPTGFDIDGFVFVCINNNNNILSEETPIPSIDDCPEAEDIEACFEEFLVEEQFPRFVAALQSRAGITAEINGESVTLKSFADICLALEGLTIVQLQDAILAIVNAALAPPGEFVPISENLVFCIAEALDIPI